MWGKTPMHVGVANDLQRGGPEHLGYFYKYSSHSVRNRGDKDETFPMTSGYHAGFSVNAIDTEVKWTHNQPQIPLSICCQHD